MNYLINGILNVTIAMMSIKIKHRLTVIKYVQHSVVVPSSFLVTAEVISISPATVPLSGV